MRTLSLSIAVVVLGGLSPAAAMGAAGDLDSNFGKGGTVVSDFGIDREEYGQDVAVDAAGRSVVVGSSETGSIDEASMAIARYTSSGDPDPSFGGGDGLVLLNLGVDSWDSAHAVAIDRAGRPVIVGTSCSDSNCTQFNDVAVVRLSGDGQLDPTFGGGDGKATEQLGSFNRPTDVAIDSSGRIVVAGAIDDEMAALRYMPSGARDLSFSGDGIALAGLAGSYGNNLTLDGKGRIVVVGEVSDAGNPADLAVVRFLDSGTPDPGFDGDGRVVTDVESLGNGDHAAGVVAYPDDRLAVLAQSTPTSLSDPFHLTITRYETGGTVDSSFGEDGVAIGGDDSFAYDIAIDGNERLLVTGRSEELGGNNALFRYSADGKPDSAFGGGDGIAPNPLGIAEALTIDPRRRIVVAGSEYVVDSDFAAARFDSGETAPPQKTLSVALAGTGGGSVAGPAIDCPGQCVHAYAEGSAIELLATPNANSTFTGWSGACSGTGACEVTLGADALVTATFAPIARAESSPAPPSGGSEPGIGAIVTVNRPSPAPKKCRKGFRRKTVKGKARCLKVKHRHKMGR